MAGWDLPGIAQELKVQAILTGRVSQRGDQLTISLWLMDVQTENAIWSEQYNRKPADLLSLQDELASDVSSKLKSRLTGEYSTLGLTLFSYDYDFAGAERQYRRAIELNPKYATAHQWYGELLTGAGRFEEAAAEYRRALEIEPLSLPINWDYGRFLYFDRKFDEAIAQHEKTLELDPSFSRARRPLTEVYLVRCEYAKAIEEQARFFELRGEQQNAALIRETYAKGGWKGYLRLVTRENSPIKDRHYILAKAYVELGEKDKAFAELNKAFENLESPIQWLKVEPQLDSLRGDPRFTELLKKTGFLQ
jgi:tetratricopeptide (TPR) repeat protein